MLKTFNLYYYKEQLIKNKPEKEEYQLHSSFVLTTEQVWMFIKQLFLTDVCSGTKVKIFIAHSTKNVKLFNSKSDGVKNVFLSKCF